MALGTLVEIAARGPDRARLRGAIEDAFREVERLEGLLSEWRETSEVSHLNREAGGAFVPVSPETEAVLRLSREIAAATGGAFDPTVLPLLRLWGFFEGAPRLPSAAAIERALEHVGWEGIEVRPGRARLARPGMSVGLGGVGKGFIADRALAGLRARGVAAALVNAGGDLAVWGGGGTRFPVQLEVPDRPGEAFAELEIGTGGMATSASTFRTFEHGGRRYSHVLDPRTGRTVPVGGSATVLAQNAARADALATACLVLGEEAHALVEDLPGVEAVLTAPDGSAWVSSGLRVQIRWLPARRQPRLVGREHDQDEHRRVEDEGTAELHPREPR